MNQRSIDRTMTNSPEIKSELEYEQEEASSQDLVQGSAEATFGPVNSWYAKLIPI